MKKKRDEMSIENAMCITRNREMMFTEESEHKGKELDQKQREATCQCISTTSSDYPCKSPVNPQSPCSKCTSIDHRNLLFSGCLDRKGTTVTVLACTFQTTDSITWKKADE